MSDGLKASMSVDWHQLSELKSPRDQMVFFNDVPWQNNAINKITIMKHNL